MFSSPLKFNPGRSDKIYGLCSFARFQMYSIWLAGRSQARYIDIYLSIPALEMLDLGLGFEIRSKKEGRRKRLLAEIKASPPALGFTPLLLQNVPELGKKIINRRVLSNRSASLGQAGIWREPHLCSCPCDWASRRLLIRYLLFSLFFVLFAAATALFCQLWRKGRPSPSLGIIIKSRVAPPHPRAT